MSQHAAQPTGPMKTRRVNVGGKPFSSRNPTTIGAIGLVLIIVLLWASFNAANLPIIGGGTSYTAYFKEDAGLRAGDEVRLAGVKIGSVSSIGLKDGKVKVVFKTKDGFIGNQSKVSIELKTLLGAKFVGIDSIGTTKQKSSDPIPLSRTTSPFDVYPAFTELTEKVDAIDTTSLAKALNTLSSAFSQTPQSVKTVLSGLSRLSTTIASRDATLKELLARANQVTTTLADRNTQLTKLFQDGNLLLQELNARRDQIHELLIETSALSIQLEGLVSDNQKTIGPLLDNLQQVLKLLNDNQASLDQGLALLGPFYRVFNNTIGNGRWFDNYICNLSVAGILGLVGLSGDSGTCT
ncbi:MAG: Phospholipid/cholesterol/gamma-HCH transport system substrate-binding protein [Marmoricola sp.]|nr:Phospholipid/cholesterol/gamma-HCH transport system substrate-binding protein [Marmoricola sp.]